MHLGCDIILQVACIYVSAPLLVMSRAIHVLNDDDERERDGRSESGRTEFGEMGGLSLERWED